MARKSKIVKYFKQLKNGEKKVRIRRRCPICGRPRGYMRDFDMCRICFRGMAMECMIPGLRKSSW